ncbi:MAG TPA: hypothetical protein VIM11_00620 [Tepidisphaeraceae bacterium]|jgi:hypothetical protein
MKPAPKKLAAWIEAALECMASDTGCARKMPGTAPPEYKITIDNSFLKSDIRDLWSDKAAAIAAKQGRRRKGGKADSRQLPLFPSEPQ